MISCSHWGMHGDEEFYLVDPWTISGYRAWKHGSTQLDQVQAFPPVGLGVLAGRDLNFFVPQEHNRSNGQS